MPGEAMREALARKHDWESHGQGHWGYGVAVDLLALERRVSALERLSGAGKSAGEDNDSPGAGWRWVDEGGRVQEGDEFRSADGKTWRPSTWRGKAPPRTYRRRRIDAQPNHDAAPAARAPTDASPLRSGSGVTVGMGTGDTQEPVAWAVMLADNHRIWGVYALEEEANAINDVVAGGHGVAPLHLQPQPTLTDEEREAIEWFAIYADTPSEERQAKALARLLERTK
jgi:hypothetical protein